MSSGRSLHQLFNNIRAQVEAAGRTTASLTKRWIRVAIIPEVDS